MKEDLGKEKKEVLLKKVQKAEKSQAWISMLGIVFGMIGLLVSVAELLSFQDISIKMYDYFNESVSKETLAEILKVIIALVAGVLGWWLSHRLSSAKKEDNSHD